MKSSSSATTPRGFIWPKLIPATLLKRYKRFLADVKLKIGENSRIDILLTGSSGERCYIEIKNCTLVNEGVAQFPDAVTARGLRHIIELENLLKVGHRCMMFYFIQRMDARVFRPADRIDPDYGRRLRQAAENGLEVLAYDVRINLKGIELSQPIPCEL